MNKSNPWYVSSQAKALAGLFLAKLKSDFSVSFDDYWADYHLQFRVSKGKILSLYVQVKAVREFNPSRRRWIVRRPDPLNDVTPIVLLLVVDIVNEKLYYGWVSGINEPAISVLGADATVEVKPVTLQTAQLIRDTLYAQE